MTDQTPPSPEAARIAADVFQSIESRAGAMYVAAILSTAPSDMTVADLVGAMKTHMTSITHGYAARAQR